ncbi:MAG: transglutaminase-like domain-containing protein [Bulleidia sp.]
MDIRVLNVPLPEDMLKLKWNGQFDLLNQMIDERLRKDIPPVLKERLRLEKEVIARIGLDFIYTKQQCLEILHERITDFKDEEFDALFRDSAFEFIFKDGVMMFKNNFYDNLIKTRKAYAQRCAVPVSQAETQQLVDVMHRMKQEGELSCRIHVKSSIHVSKEYEKPGKTVRVWLPIPKEYAQVEDLKIIHTSHACMINDNDVDERCIFIEKTLEKDEVFSVEYSFINHMKYQNLDPSVVTDEHPDECLGELSPHIVFTGYLRSVLEDILQGETNPLLKAKKIYDYITSHVMYSFMRRYVTLPSIAEYCLTSMKGDCGVQALTFITLCRMAGIPAQWQAGLYATPLHIGNHDWARFYIAPYGWLYADCSFGGSAYRAGDEERRDFYFGCLDPFRIPCSSAFQGGMTPAMKSLANDPFDNQNGEMEYIDEAIPCQYVEHQTQEVEIRIL